MSKIEVLRAAAAASAIAAFACAAPAFAQRTDNNATTQAADAFGKSVGDQSIGIYNSNDVRGFSPVDAGNVRIEGLYFDQQAGLTSRLSDGNTIRVGLSAQSYPFPAPTGIADFTLRQPGSKRIVSAALNYGPYGGGSAELDVQLPLDGERLGVVGGLELDRSIQPFGGTPRDFFGAALVHWSPAPDTHLTAFWSYGHESDAEAQPLIFSAGAYLPKRIARNRFFGQPWADNASTGINYGAIARAKPLGIDVSLGVFRSIGKYESSVADLLFGTDRTGAVADRVVVIENGDRAASTSGELRAARSFTQGSYRHTVIASIRARALDRLYGGAAIVDLGPSRSDVEDVRARPAIVDGPKTTDRVRQVTLGLAYQGKWRDVAEFSLGLQKTSYTKSITDPNPAIVFPQSKSSPWLPSATAALNVTHTFALYAGYTRGLEESPVAPSNAINLNEAPPAIRTEQKDGGVRWKIGKQMTVVAGVFDVAKPYFNVDAAGRFRQLGMVRNRGLEFSVAGQVAKGLNVIAGNVLIDAKVSGEDVDRGLIGRKPVATFVRHTILGINYAVPPLPGVSVDTFIEGTSDRVGDAANSFVIPARAIVALGARYRFKVHDARFLLRGQVANIGNVFGWSNGGSGYFVANGSRRFLLSLAVDA